MVFNPIAVEELAKAVQEHFEAFGKYAEMTQQLGAISDPKMAAAVQPTTQLALANFRAINTLGRILADHFALEASMDALGGHTSDEG